MSLITDREWFLNHETTEELKKHFEQYCNHCWNHGCGNCTRCKKIYNKIYIPMRKKELQIKLGIKSA